MSRNEGKSRADIYARITDRIVADLERGVRPWVKPWGASNMAGRITRPLRHTGQPYSGINVILLWSEAVARGFRSPIWMTARPAIFAARAPSAIKARAAISKPTPGMWFQDCSPPKMGRTAPHTRRSIVVTNHQTTRMVRPMGAAIATPAKKRVLNQAASRTRFRGLGRESSVIDRIRRTVSPSPIGRRR